MTRAHMPGMYCARNVACAVHLLHAVSLARAGDPRAEVKRELEQRDRYVRKYTVQQILIFVPLATVLLALIQRRQPAAA